MFLLGEGVKLNWEKIFKNATKNKRFSLYAKAKAESFRTCPIDESFEKNRKYNVFFVNRYLMDKFGKDRGNLLYHLGMDFYPKVAEDNIREAKNIYNKIIKLKSDKNTEE